MSENICHFCFWKFAWKMVLSCTRICPPTEIDWTIPIIQAAFCITLHWRRCWCFKLLYPCSNKGYFIFIPLWTASDLLTSFSHCLTPVFFPSQPPAEVNVAYFMKEHLSAVCVDWFCVHPLFFHYQNWVPSFLLSLSLVSQNIRRNSEIQYNLTPSKTFEI